MNDELTLLRRIVAVLFPPMLKTDYGWIDFSIDDIDGAIIDIERNGGQCDEVCLNTLKRASLKIAEARQLLNMLPGDEADG